MILATLIIASTIICVIILWFKYHVKVLSKGFPGPPTKPIIGNGGLLMKYVDDRMDVCFKNTLKVLREECGKYGSPYALFFGAQLYIYANDPNSIEALLKSGNLVKPYVFYLNNCLDGIISGNGEKWKQQRRILMPFFHTTNMETYVKVFNEKARNLCDRLNDLAGKGAFNAKNKIGACTLAIASSTACSVKDSPETNEEFVKLATRFGEIFMYRSIRTWLHPDYIFYRTKTGAEEKALATEILKFGKQILEKRKAERNEVGQNIDSVEGYEEVSIPYIDRLMKYAEKTSMPPVMLHRVIIDVIISGFDSTAVTTSHALLMLGIHQDIQEKVYKEVKDIFKDSNRPATVEDLDNMKYLEMVLQEAVRYTTPPLQVRQIDKGVKIGDRVIPETSCVLYIVYDLHRNPEHWDKPNEFYPEHFLPENVEKRPKFSYVPFGYGARSCPGHRYSFYAMKTIISTLLRRYKVTSSMTQNEVIDKEYPVFMLEVMGGYPIEIQERKD